MVFDEVEPLRRRQPPAAGRDLGGRSGFALLRDRLVRELRGRRRRSAAAAPARVRARRRRSRATAWRMSRETCICETPMRSPISACVRSSSKRRRSTSRSRGVIVRISRSSVARSSAQVVAVARRRRPCRPACRRPRRSAPRGVVERGRAVGAGGLQRLEHVLLVDSDAPRRARPPSAAVQVARELADRAVDLQRQLLEVARDADRPGAVAEVALDLAEDRRDRVARERDLALERRSGRSP